MKYLIDGYNVIKSSYLGKEGDLKGKLSLYQILDNYKANHLSVIFSVVLDGFNTSDFPFLRDKRIKTFFSGEITADEYIKKILEKGKRNEEITVVSDDKQVQISSKLFGCNVMSVDTFLNTVNPKGNNKPKGPIEKKISYSKKKKIEEELKNYYELRKNT
ncbi:MAG TPA: NYN domain-containing protein [bacterium]|nr:NYN domain-containing protein [bacterium]